MSPIEARRQHREARRLRRLREWQLVRDRVRKILPRIAAEYGEDIGDD